MKAPLLFLSESLFCSGLFWVFYRAVLVRRAPLRLCRSYLLLSTLLAVTLPLLQIPLYPAESRSGRAPGQPLAVFGQLRALSGEAPEPAVPEPERPLPVARVQRTGRAAWGFYAGAVCLLLLLSGRHVVRVRRLKRRARLTPCAGYTLAEHADIHAPFAFWRTVFIGFAYTGEERAQVICHEASHVRHGHTFERVALEALRCFCWWNPFVWMAGRQLEEVQEWEADRDVLAQGADLTQYRILIFRQLFGYNPDMTCGLNYSLTKNRFLMMTQFKGGSHSLLRLAALLPVVAVMMLFCSFTRKSPAPSAESAPIVRADSLPVGCPPLTGGRMGSGFGERPHPVTDRAAFHRGVDLVAAEGEPVLAAFDGVVDTAAYVGGYGNLVVLRHADGWKSRYAHLQCSLVELGQRVAAGDCIGRVGATGRAAGPHLHFETERDGRLVDPQTLFSWEFGMSRTDERARSGKDPD